MKKIMFNDKYGLTQAVLDGRKTMTRRIAFSKEINKPNHGFLTEGADAGKLALCDRGLIVAKSTYKVGEVVAVAQAYKDTFNTGQVSPLVAKAGWTNKMFVRADWMHHQIRITNIRVERLQEIPDEDVYKEGFAKQAVNNGWGNAAWHWEAMLVYYDSFGRTKEIRSIKERDAFAALIDKVSGEGTWESNPWVFVYEFELVK